MPVASPHDSDFTAIARACGLPAISASSALELSQGLDQTHAQASPLVVVCKVDIAGTRNIYEQLVRLTQTGYGSHASAARGINDSTLAD